MAWSGTAKPPATMGTAGSVRRAAATSRAAPGRRRGVDHADDDGAQVVASRDRGGQGRRRRVRAQVEDLVAGLGEDVCRASRRRGHDARRPASPPGRCPGAGPGGGTWAHAPDDRGRHAAGEVLLLDADLTPLPGRADAVQGRPQDLDVDVLRLDARGHGRLDDLPRARAVTGQHPLPEALGPRRPSPRLRCHGGCVRKPGCRRAGRASGSLRRGDIGRIDAPRAADLAGRQHPQADVAVDRHVVHAEAVRRLVEGQQLAAPAGPRAAISCTPWAHRAMARSPSSAGQRAGEDLPGQGRLGDQAEDEVGRLAERVGAPAAERAGTGATC